MALVKFNNDKKGNALMPAFSDIFESFFNDAFISDRMVARVPGVNISETPEHYHIDLAAPGLKKENFKINLEHNMITISAEQRSENTDDGKTYNKREFCYTSFVRSFALPETADDAHIDASYVDGILKIDVAKKEEAKSVSRQIEIK
jgi:HSP20 family protein